MKLPEHHSVTLTPEIRRPGVFGPKVAAGFSTRHGGRSSRDFGTLNVGLNTADVETAVLQNRNILFGAIGKKWSDVAVAGQVHGTSVTYVNAPGLYANTDALVTDRPGQILAITAADCAVVLIADEVEGVVAACHAGWRGAAGRVCSLTIKSMIGLGAKPEHMRAYVSPCISADRFEVGDEVARLFDDRHVVRKKEWPRPHVDLKAVLAEELSSCGISAAAMEVSDECTFDSPDFYSYRRCTGRTGRTGRMMGFIMMLPTG
ncbi:MAG: peptidoglycan editing factor PgeF [Rhodothermales bacterium]|nr:peptidoglycan editing factor PgeF [Rhodothermales bacterium]